METKNRTKQVKYEKIPFGRIVAGSPFVYSDDSDEKEVYLKIQGVQDFGKHKNAVDLRHGYTRYFDVTTEVYQIDYSFQYNLIQAKDE